MAAASQARPQLSDLPLELLQFVWQNLDRKAYKSLRGTSKFFNKLSTPLLFQTFVLYPHVRSFERLIHISQQPHLARYVENLHYNTILLGLTEMITRRLQSVYSAHIVETERQKALEHAQYLHQGNLRADIQFDELAQLSYFDKALVNLMNLRSFTVIDATGLQAPSASLIHRLPHFYEQFVQETCGRFEHTRLEREMFGTPRCRGGSYSRGVIMALHKIPKPVDRLILRGIRWPALLAHGDFLSKHRMLFEGVLSNLKHFELSQSHDPLFPGRICMGTLQSLLRTMVNLEQLDIAFRLCGGDVQVKGRGMTDVVNGIRTQSYFSGSVKSFSDGSLPAQMTWSSKLKTLSLTGLVCSGKEIKSILKHCAGSLVSLALGDIVLTPEEHDGPRACFVHLFKWIQTRLKLEHVEIFGTLTNGGMQEWQVDSDVLPFASSDESLAQLLVCKVHKYLLEGGACPLDHVSIPANHYDLGKQSYTADVPSKLRTVEFLGDDSWTMEYEHDYHEDAWSDDDDLDIDDTDDDEDQLWDDLDMDEDDIGGFYPGVHHHLW